MEKPSSWLIEAIKKSIKDMLWVIVVAALIALMWLINSMK